MRSLRWSSGIHSPSPSWIIYCLLFLSCPTWGGGLGLAFIQSNRLCACAHGGIYGAPVHGICPRHWAREQIQPMWQTECRLFNGKVDERWHSLATFHTPPTPHSPPRLGFHLDEPSRQQVVTVTTTNNVYMFFCFFFKNKNQIAKHINRHNQRLITHT